MSMMAKLKYHELDGRALDDPFVTAFHRQVIQTKPFLHRLYRSYYSAFVKAEETLQHIGGISLELGSGGGFLKDLIPELVTSDTVKYPWVDRAEDAFSLSFQAGSLKAIYMTGVLHHLGQPKAFFREATRCLRPGGAIVMMEPHMSLFGRIFFKKLHHEPNDLTAREWEFPQTGPLSDANTALRWIIFDRDAEKFRQEFPELRVTQRNFHTFLLYGLSGGVSFRFGAPGFTYPALQLLEDTLKPLMYRYLGTMQTIRIERVR